MFSVSNKFGLQLYPEVGFGSGLRAETQGFGKLPRRARHDYLGFFHSNDTLSQTVANDLENVQDFFVALEGRNQICACQLRA